MEGSGSNLLDWYARLHVRSVDLVGDYAGSELFLVEGDSLLLRCWSDTKLDFHEGFQLLHAIYNVESFLQRLVQRKCNFGLVFFDENEELGIPGRCRPSNRFKYLLARAVLIRHLQVQLPSSQLSVQIDIFKSVHDIGFVNYLKSSGAYFILCHDGAELTGLDEGHSSTREDIMAESRLKSEDSSRKFAYRSMIYSFINQNYNVALIHELKWIDTKIMTSVVERSQRANSMPTSNLESFRSRKRQDSAVEATIENFLFKLGIRALPPLPDNEMPSHPRQLSNDIQVQSLVAQYLHTSGSSERSILALITLAYIFQNRAPKSHLVLAFIIHTILIGESRISERPQMHGESVECPAEAFDFLEDFSNVSRQILTWSNWSHAMKSNKSRCDIADLIDGRLYKAVFFHLGNGNVFRHKGIDQARICAQIHGFADGLRFLSGKEINLKDLEAFWQTEFEPDSKPGPSHIKTLPFSNPIFDIHLAPIKIDMEYPIVVDHRSVRVFQEISHWHNAKRKVNPKSTCLLSNKAKSRALRPDQFRTTEMQAYAASLTNAAGKILNPDIITVSGKKSSKGSIEMRHCEEGGGSNRLIQPRGNSNRKANCRKPVSNTIAVSGSVEDDELVKGHFLSWHNLRKHLENETLSSKYLKIKSYLRDLPDNKRAVLQAEVEFYLLTTLIDIFENHCNEKAEGGNIVDQEFYGVAALIWDTIRKIPHASGLTMTISEHLNIFLKLLGMPLIDLAPSASDRKLSFEPKLTFPNIEKTSLTFSSIEFQCMYCGPYMDRDLGSTFDSRVAFRPDEWQRRVLDELDADRSVFVVAPTSAGKTFISFYAMERVLRTDDDSVLVYVAPTKALVNQIAAEIQGRFRKNYKYGSKSVWAIHTRDYRVNNPSGCQILVTVPHILQIMLLAPGNATTWSTRVKRIIFDEIHSIGNAEDGVVWEQLLLLAPCPIIALSATVGNPEKFNSWLTSTQESAGYELTMINHPYRYSDLRKYAYRPPKYFSFYGLSERSLEKNSLAALGLDGLENFAFIHPVGSLVNKSRGMPDDLSLEARDCFSLWKSMLQHQTEKFPVHNSLGPTENGLNAITRKADIIRWQKKLKALLQTWMRNDDSPFDKVVEDLGISANEVRHTNQVSKRHPTDSESEEAVAIDTKSVLDTTFPLLCKLHERNALPAIFFNYDRSKCEEICQVILKKLEEAESNWKSRSGAWQKTMSDWDRWKKNEQVRSAKRRAPKITTKNKGQKGEHNESSKADRIQEVADIDVSPFANFDENAPVDGFHFAAKHKAEASELEQNFWHLKKRGVAPWLMDALIRGIGVHHAGMNRKYRQIVEILFRKGYLRVVIATGTLALGINMPCVTVVFSGDSVFLTALNFRQGAGRAGRRGFDLLGNVVFQNISDSKVCQLISSRLPDLNGHFPITTTLILRLFILLYESKNSPYAIQAVNSLLSQPRLYLDGLAFKDQVLHHLRFSIEYLRRHDLLSSQGVPINFAGLTSHLYYTENSSFALNALLKKGFFHELCSAVDKRESNVLRSLMIVMAHLFGRRPCRQADQEYVETFVKRSPSIVFLPPLPSQAAQILREHNQDTLQIFTDYVKTFVDQHIQSEDCLLPLTKLSFGGDSGLGSHAAFTPSKAIRSAFVALSGHGDAFDSISDLCGTTREGVFLEEAVIPHLDVYPDEVNTPLNAYLYDFYMHGDLSALEIANRIPKSDIWFLLNDFSLVLATIVSSLANFLKISDSDEFSLLNIMGHGDEQNNQKDYQANQEDDQTNEEDDKFAIGPLPENTTTTPPGASPRQPTKSPSNPNPKPKSKSEPKIVESWDDDIDDDEKDEDENEDEAEDDGGKRSVEEMEQGFRNIFTAFQKLRAEFDERFKKIYA